MDILRNLSSANYRQYSKDVDSGGSSCAKSEKSKSSLRSGRSQRSAVSELNSDSKSTHSNSPVKGDKLKAENHQLKERVRKQDLEI